MKWLLSVCALAAVSFARADEPWAIEIGIEAKALLASPVMQKLKTRLGQDYDDVMNQSMEKGGFRLDQIVRISGGCPTFKSFETIDESLVMVFEFGSAEDVAKIIRHNKTTKTIPAGFVPDYPTAVGYLESSGKSVLVVDGTRVIACAMASDKPNGPLVSAAIKNHSAVAKTMAAAKSHQYARVDGAVMNLARQLPLPPQAESFKPLLESTGYTWNLSLTESLNLELKSTFVNEKDADGAKDAVEQLLALAGVGLNTMKTEMEKEKSTAADAKAIYDILQKFRKGLKPKLDGTTLVMKTEVDNPETLIAMLAGAVRKVREAAARAQSQNNLKHIALAQHNYESTHQQFAGNVTSKDAKPKELLSWRVGIAYYLENANQFGFDIKMDEPWDSEANKKLLAQMPKVFAHPNADPKVTAAGKTHYRAFRGVGPANGPNECFLSTNPSNKLRITSITDGLSNTIMLVEAAEPVEWTKPEALEFDPKKPLPKLGGLSKGGFNVVLCDGSVRFIKDGFDEKTLKAMLTRSGGEVVKLDP